MNLLPNIILFSSASPLASLAAENEKKREMTHLMTMRAKLKRRFFGGGTVLPGPLQEIGSPPKTLPLGMWISMIVLLLLGEQSLLSTWQQPSANISLLIALEILFHANILLLLVATLTTRLPVLLGCLVGVSIANLLLNLLYPSVLSLSALPAELLRGHWGDIGLWIWCEIVWYRFPTGWARLLILPALLILLGSNLSAQMPFMEQPLSNIPLLIAELGVLCCSFLGILQRGRAVLFLELQDVQAQLRWQIEQTEELAATHERTRIARDMHDIFAHTLTVLSIQIQAARQMIYQSPERLESKLEEIANLLRESTAESRRVVSVLREPALSPQPHGMFGTMVQTILDRFDQRTGIHCMLEEEGNSCELSEEQSTTLRYALQEALTNAHRHGRAQTIWVALRWQERQVLLSIHDSGQRPDLQDYHHFTADTGESTHVQSSMPLHSPSTHTDLPATPSGHHGLRGMYERVSALGGILEAGPHPERGFRVSVSLPISQKQHMYRRQM